MFRPNSTTNSSITGAIFAHDKRPYILVIAVLTLLLVYTNYPSNSSVASPVRRTLPVVPYPGSSPLACPIPICECECDCGNGQKVQLTGVTKSQTIHALPTVTLPSASSSSALSLSLPSPSDGLISPLWPRLTKQIYTSRPSVIKVATTQQDDDGTDYMQFVRATYPPVGPEKGSIMDPSYLITPIAFGTPEAPIKDGDEIKYKDFPIGDNAFVPRPQCQKESDILQNYIYANQHPPDCKTAKLFVRRHMPSWGLFAGLGLSSNYLYLATVLGRTLIDLSPNTYLTGTCHKNGLECAFLPVGSCTANDFREDEVCYGPPCWDTARVISIDRFRTTDYLPCSPTEYPKERCNLSGGPKIHHSLHELLPGLRYHGEQFFQGEFTRYLTRPNAYLAEFTAGIMKNLTLTDELISVHVRHGDKTEGILFPNRAYGLVVRRAIQVTGIKTVFLGSDDNTVYEEVPKWVNLPGITYKWIDPSLNPIVHSASQAGTKGKNKIGMYLLAQNIIFAQSHTYIGTRSSNIGQVAFSLQNNDCSRPRIDYDMYGDLYYNSWYCRNDIEHAGREWMCALEKPGPGDTMWKWGGAKTQC